MRIDETKNKLNDTYNMYLQTCRVFQDKAPLLSLEDWESFYPIFCFNTSDINATLATNIVGGTLIINKSEAFKPKMHCLILQEVQLKMNVHGSQITVIEPYKGGQK